MAIALADKFENVMSGLGTERDKSAYGRYVSRMFSEQDLLETYRNSWLARAVVDYPAQDATRKWRSWKAKADQIGKIEAEEHRLNLQKRVQDALVAARLFGGAALYINTGSQDQGAPLRGNERVESLPILPKSVLKAGDLIDDINDPWYGYPEFYTLTGRTQEVKIHRSRLVIFRGHQVPGAQAAMINQGWGDSALQSTYDAIQQVDSTMANLAALVYEAKVDVFLFKGLADQVATTEGTDALQRRLSVQSRMKGILGAVVADADDTYEQKNAQFGGLDTVVAKFQDNVSGAAGIPVTRLYGRAAVGLSGSGDGDERVYFDRIGHQQATENRPALAMLDECIIYSALGSRPPEIFYEWRALRQLTESERADIFSKTCTALRSLAGNAMGEIIPADALETAAINEFIEMGVMPGIEQWAGRDRSEDEDELEDPDEDLLS